MSLPFITSPHGAEPVVAEALFKADAQRMFDAWTTPDDVRAWFGPGPDQMSEIEIDLRVGGRYRFVYALDNGVQDTLSGIYREIVSPNRLSYSWVHTRTFEDGRSESTAESVVTITFDAQANGTFVRLVHEAIRSIDGREGVGNGWSGTFVRLAASLGIEEAA
ncbi:MAG: SRPBCC domain-containing protein [Pseudomonadota bacterium]